MPRAEREGVVPYLASIHLGMPNRNEIRKKLAAADLLQIKMLELVSREFAARGIRWGLLKGLALACTIYDDPLARSAGDCDIIVPLDRREDAAKALIAKGFFRDPAHAELFSSPLGQIDLHTEIINSDRVPSRSRAFTDEFRWQDRLVAFQADKLELLTLDPEATAFYLANHLVHHHGLVGAKWLIDLDQILKRDSSARESIRNSGRHGGTLIELLDLIFGRSVGSSLAARLFATANRDGISPPGTRFFLTALAMPDLAARGRFIRETLFPSREVMRQVHSKRGGGIKAQISGIAETLRDWTRIAARTVLSRR